MPDFNELIAPGNLAQVFGLAQEEIMIEWRVLAGELLKKLNLDEPTITDHVPELVGEITSDLSLAGTGQTVEALTRNSPPRHGAQRFHDGLNVGEVVSEYNLLRTAFSTIAERHGLYIAGESGRIINYRIDEAVRLAVQAFAALQTSIRQKQQEEHLSFLAHDLRTPLNAASLLAEAIKMDLPPEVRVDTNELFDLLERNLQRVDNLLRRVLDSNRMSSGLSGGFQPEMRTFDLWPVVQRLILDQQPLKSGENSVRVVNNIPPGLSIEADAGLISQVFQNLLSNAYRFNADGTVTVGAEGMEGGVKCSVSDDGPGIDDKILPRIFEKLVTDPNNPGTGLGLTIVKQIVEAHGGTVDAKNNAGGGALLSFFLPRRSGH